MDLGREYADFAKSSGHRDRFPQIDRDSVEKVRWVTTEEVRDTSQRFLLHVFANHLLHFAFYFAFFGLSFVIRRARKWVARLLSKPITKLTKKSR